MARTKMVGVALATAAVFAGSAATPAQAAETHHCGLLFGDPTLLRACELVLDVVCITRPPHPICT